MQRIFCDIETQGLESTYDINCHITRVGIAVDDEPAISYSYTDLLDSTLLFAHLKTYIMRNDRFVFHNAAFDVPTLRLNGFDIRNYDDTMCMSYCLNPAPLNAHSLATLAQEAGGGEKMHFDFKSAPPQEGDEEYDEWALDLEEYNVNDVEITRNVFYYLQDRLAQDPRLLDYYHTVELPYIERIIAMQGNGVLMNTAELISMGVLLDGARFKMVQAMENRVGLVPDKEVIYSKKVIFATRPKIQMVGYNKRNNEITYDHCLVKPFNPNSGDQIEMALAKDGFTDFVEFTGSGKPSFTRDALEQLAHPLARSIVELKDLDAVLKFVPPLRDGVDSRGRLRTSFKQFNTRTGRLSSAAPNLQNMPAQKKAGDTYSYRADDAYNIRKCFIAPEGYSLVVGDLNRIELVVLAYYLELVLGFTGMSDAVRAGEDLHQSNADLWHCERRVAKTVIFCLVYGGGANKIAHITGIAVKEAKQVIKRIYATTPIEELKEELISHARKNKGCFKDVMGRLLRVEGIVYDRQGQEYARASRQCFNYLIQGGASSVFKVLQNGASMSFLDLTAASGVMSYINSVNVDRQLKDAGLHQLLQVHDEVVYEAPEKLADDYCKVLTSLYTNDTILVGEDFAVPITCEFHHGKNWYEAKEKSS